MTYSVFLNGEMLDESIASRVLGGEWEQRKFSFAGYETEVSPCGKACVKKHSGSFAEGMMAQLDGEQLWRLDQWKDVPALRRVSLNSDGDEKGFFVYLAAEHILEAEGYEDGMDAMLDSFEKKRNMGGNRKCDLYLLYSCAAWQKEDASGREKVKEKQQTTSMITSEELLREQENQKELCTFFLEKLEQYNHEEFDGSFFRDIIRKPLGIVRTVITLDKEDFFQYGFAYVSTHPQTGAAMMGVTFLSLSVPMELELCGFCSDDLKIVMEDGQRVTAGEWMEKKGLTPYGSPKAVAFSYSPMGQEEILRCLACEMFPMGNLVGEELNRWSRENFAQYDIAQVYASDRCLLEISQMEGQLLKERLNVEAVELFFLELLMMQEAAIARVSDRTYELFREGVYREDSSGSQEVLFSLSQEAASAVLFVNFKKLRFPTVRISVQKIAERFGVAEGLENYRTCREMLEQMIAMNTAEAEKADGDLMNLLLLFLTMMQVLPVFADMVRYMVEGQWNPVDVVSSMGGAAGCLALYLLYRVAFQRRQKRFMERRFSKK